MAKQVKSKNINDLLKEIESERDSNAILYSTGGKQPVNQFGTVVANDVLDYFKIVLKSFKTKKKVSLLLNTMGGNLETPWPLVNLIREYSDDLEVIVVKEALSAGTLIALGASKIVMLPFSHLSPVDPATNNNNKKLEIEDIIGFINFAKEKVGITEQGALAEVVKELTKEVNPTLLGSANRTHSLIRKLARQLLDLNKVLNDMSKKEVVQSLTQDLYFHGHRINREEAKKVIGFGDMIEYASDSLEETVELILAEIEDILKLGEVFDVKSILGNNAEADYKLNRAMIYTKNLKFNFMSEYKIFAVPDPSGNLQFQLTELNSKWLKI
jgi:hypothetical protein